MVVSVGRMARVYSLSKAWTVTRVANSDTVDAPLTYKPVSYDAAHHFKS
jgi:hypothetical protein